MNTGFAVWARILGVIVAVVGSLTAVVVFR